MQKPKRRISQKNQKPKTSSEDAERGLPPHWEEVIKSEEVVADDFLTAEAAVEEKKYSDWQEATNPSSVKEAVRELSFLGPSEAERLYPPPKKTKVFVDKWRALIEDISSRPNFKRGHLFQLEILCDLFVECDRLTRYLEKVGYTYHSEKESRYGDFVRSRPESAQLNRARSEIRNYSQILGLKLYKDTKVKTDQSGDEWK